MNRRYVFFTDPGHGWLAVPIEHLAELDIRDQVSACSYYDASTGMAMLEEDADATLFVKAAKAKGWEFTAVEECEPVNYSWVRSLPAYPWAKGA